MIARALRLVALLMVMANFNAALCPVLAGPAERRAEHAAETAKRSKDATEKLRGNMPFERKRRELQIYHDALERAEQSEESAMRNAATRAREADRATRQAVSRGRERKHQQRRKVRRKRHIDRIKGR